MSLVQSVKWITVSQVFKIVAQLISIFYLTTLIPPQEYGVLAMAAVVMNFASIFNELGTGAAIIQKQGISVGFYNFIYKINMATGFFVMFSVLLLSPLIVYYFQEPKLYNILFLLSFSFPIVALSITHKSNFEKEQKFKFLAKVEIFSSLVGLLFAIVMANLNFGVYSLIAQILVSVFLFTIIVVRFSDLHLSLKTKIDKSEVSGVLGFSGNLFLFNLINYFTRNLDSILIGRFFSSAILGVYSLAYRIMLFPIQNLTFVVSRAFLPHLTKDLDNIAKNRDDYFKCVFIILSLCSPLMLGLAALSKDFVLIFFDEKWSLLSDLLVWLAPTAIIQSILSTTGTVFTAYAKTFWLFLLGSIGAALMTGAFFWGIHFDIKTLAKFYFFANILNFFPVMILLGRVLKFSLMDILKIIFKTTFPAFVMYLGVVFLNNNIFLNSMVFQFLLKVILGILIYIFIYLIINRAVVSMLLNQLKVRLVK
ncbi:lipopolysaccharide biosynthesis protein [Acinetobacter pittii]|uniref:lipopolysaccharide biosynthesis protein n=1 Tax=Acinetobacter pittii TaxID=48296 RepID=UPI0008382FF7|nr:lipopolysaccharide biosynthesis protein [Acinetobacter pittii]OCY73485.1 hypothetical protein BFR86_06675 [Acinetobacter pittii]OCY79092.1 hypothetical protein BFR88_08385 [Acinetobacter pittii]OCY83701.1 hypothetical protein BFR87_02730 [Acinetobacter pittii]